MQTLMHMLFHKMSARGEYVMEKRFAQDIFFAFHFRFTHITTAPSPSGERACRDMIKGRITR